MIKDNDKMKFSREYVHSQHCFLLYLQRGRKTKITLENEKAAEACEKLNLFRKWDRKNNKYIACDGNVQGAYYDYERLYDLIENKKNDL